MSSQGMQVALQRAGPSVARRSSASLRARIRERRRRRGALRLVRPELDSVRRKPDPLNDYELGGFSLLTRAVLRGNPWMVMFLLEFGARVTEVERELSVGIVIAKSKSLDEEGMKPLREVARIIRENAPPHLR